MELAISPASPVIAPNELVELTVLAEQLGYRSAWLAEVGGPEAFSLAGAIATRTERIALGVAVVPAATRSPALLAMGASTISGLLRGRRFDLGIGASSRLIVESWHGRSFDSPLATVEETVRATRALLAGERSFHGTTVNVDRFRLATSAGGPTGLFVGALGPGMLRLAGAVGDGVCLNLMTAAAVGRQLEEIRLGAVEAGRDLPADFGVMARLHAVVTDDPSEGVARLQAAFGPYFAQPVYNRFLEWMGFPDEAAAIRVAFEAGDRAGVAAGFHPRLVQSLALVGSVGTIRNRLDEYAVAGVGVGAINVIAEDATAIADAIRRLAPTA